MMGSQLPAQRCIYRPDVSYLRPVAAGEDPIDQQDWKKCTFSVVFVLRICIPASGSIFHQLLAATRRRGKITKLPNRGASPLPIK